MLHVGSVLTSAEEAAFTRAMDCAFEVHRPENVAVPLLTPSPQHRAKRGGADGAIRRREIVVAFVTLCQAAAGRRLRAGVVVSSCRRLVVEWPEGPVRPSQSGVTVVE